MTRASLREYAAVQQERYLRATRAEKRQLLDEVVAVTGIHRKAAIRLLRRLPRARARPSRAGRPRRYGPAVASVAAVLWQASGQIGAHRLHPFVPELLAALGARRPRSAPGPGEYRHRHPLPEVFPWRRVDDGSGNPDL